MSELVELTGMIIKTMPVREYDKRLVILTGEAGKITAFARGARRMGGKLMGTTEPFCFGCFKLFPGKDAYTLTETDISRFFEELRSDYDAYAYGSYFLEIADYYTRENMEAYEEINLIYASLAALISGRFDRRLVRSAYEIRSLVIAGEYPGVPDSIRLSDPAAYGINRIVESPLHGLYSFMVSEEVLKEIEEVSSFLMKHIVGHEFRSQKLICI